jgi:hypothetical protein
MTTLLKNDLIFYKNADGNITSGGYNVESHMLQKGISPMQTLNLSQYGGKDDKVSNNFENLAVPAGIYYITQQNNKKNKEQMVYKKEHVALPDDIFDKLYTMIEYDDKKKRKTKRQLIQQTKKTKKHKNKL